MKRGLEIFRAIVYNVNMKNQLPRKYRIISRVCRSDAPENIVSSRYVGMHNGFADDSCRVRRSDAPENLVSLRYVDRCYDDAGMGKTAETLVLSGFSGGGGGRTLSPVRLSHTQCALIHGNPLKADDHRYVIPQRSCCEPRKAVALRDLKQKMTQVKPCEKDYKGIKSKQINRFNAK